MTFLDLPLHLQTIKLLQNTAATLRFTVTQGGLPFNLDTYVVTLTTKISFAEASPTWSVTGAVVNGSEGICEVVLSSTETAAAQTLIAELRLTRAAPAASRTLMQCYLEVGSATT